MKQPTKEGLAQNLRQLPACKPHSAVPDYPSSFGSWNILRVFLTLVKHLLHPAPVVAAFYYRKFSDSTARQY